MITRKYDVYCGIDVGKTAHHAVALAADGTRILSRPLPQDENAITALLGELATAGSVLVVVDQPRNIGAMPVAVARTAGADVAYLSGLRMRRIADLYPGNAKTDVRDAFIIADAARTLPDTLLPIAQHDDIVEGLRMLAGFDADLAAEENRINGRIRSVLLTVHPALERAIGKHLYRPVGVAVLAAFGGPIGLAVTTSAQLREVTRAAAPRIGDAVADSIEAALGEQTVTVPGAEKADFVLRTLARQLHQVREARADLEVQFVAELDRHPAGPILTSMPGVAARTAVTILVEIADIDRFQNAGHLAVYAGVAPRTPHPQIRNLHPRRTPPTQRQRQTQTRHVPFGVRVTPRTRIPRLLRPKTSRREKPPRRTDMPIQATIQCPLCHAQERFYLSLIPGADPIHKSSFRVRSARP